jgi:hypothetical protein
LRKKNLATWCEATKCANSIELGGKCNVIGTGKLKRSCVQQL